MQGDKPVWLWQRNNIQNCPKINFSGQLLLMQIVNCSVAIKSENN